MRWAARSSVLSRVSSPKPAMALLVLGDQRRQPRRHRLLDRAVALRGAGQDREALHPAVDPAQERLRLVHEGGVLLRHEERATLLADGEEVGLALEQLLDDAGDVGAGSGLQAAVQPLLGQGGQAG
jgi:hypothetical protein